MTPKESFESAEYLAAWAASELDDLEQMLKTFLKEHSATVVKELNPKTNRNDVKLKFSPPPFKARGLASNIVKNLRDALDQVTNAATHHIMGKEKKRAHFPFGGSPDDFDTAVTKNQCRDIPAELYPILKSYEPYPTGEGYQGGNNYLRLLGKISGSHKHRVSLIVTLAPADLSITLGSIHSGRNGGELWPYLKSPPPTNHELVLFTFGRGGHAHFDLNATFYVAFAHPDLRDIPADHFLRTCQTTVAHIVQDLQAKALQITPRA